LALDLCTRIPMPPNAPIVILSDCQTAINEIFEQHEYAHDRWKTTTTCFKLLTTLEEKGHSVTIDWVPGHASLELNEQADRLAKSCLTSNAGRTSPDISAPAITQSAVKYFLRVRFTQMWQGWWDNPSSKGRAYHLRHPHVTIKPDPKLEQVCIPRLRRCITRLRLGSNICNTWLHKLRPPKHPTGLCSCGLVDTRLHQLLDCPRHRQLRLHALSRLQSLHPELTLEHCLAYLKFPEQWQSTLISTLAEFLMSSKLDEVIIPALSSFGIQAPRQGPQRTLFHYFTQSTNP
jgi:hypothetical protein